MQSENGPAAAGSRQRRAAVQAVSSRPVQPVEDRGGIAYEIAVGHFELGHGGEGMKPWVTVGAAMAVIAVVALSRYEVYLGEYIGPHDDYNWFYMTAAKIGEPERGDRLLRHFNGLDDDIVHRVRSDYEQNYLGVSAVYRVAAELTELKYRRRLYSQYPSYIGSAMVSGFDAAFVL